MTKSNSNPNAPGTNTPPSDSGNNPIGSVQPADQADQNQITQFVTTIRNAQEQVGDHIIRALQHSDTVAVITTLTVGPDGKQRVISAALNAQRMQQVQELLNSAQQERIEEQPCVGFHCLVNPKTAVPDNAGPDNAVSDGHDPGDGPVQSTSDATD